MTDPPDRPPHILIVEDEPAMRLGLCDNLEFEGYAVDGRRRRGGLRKLLGGAYDLVLLDVMLPRRSGLDVCKIARREGVTTPIIMLTAKGEEIDKVLGLELGADDYVVKPFSLRELLARMKAVLRRGAPDAPAPRAPSKSGGSTSTSARIRRRATATTSR